MHIPLLLSPQQAADLSLAEAPAAAATLIAPVTVDAPDALETAPPVLGDTLPVSKHLVELADAAGSAPKVVRPAKRLQCVTFARELTGMDLFGDAKTWWAKARGLYDELTAPQPGAVMVFAGDRRIRLGHVAVVKAIVSAREVRVDHANWGNDGRIYLNAPVVDVSPNNDWSLVRVWNARVHALGSHIYRLKGFLAE